MKTNPYIKPVLHFLFLFLSTTGIALAQLGPLTGVITKNPSCTCLTANPSGGTPPYTYLWSNGLTTQTICPQPPVGFFTVIIMDAGSLSVVAQSSLDCCKMRCPNDTIICFNVPDSLVLKSNPKPASAGTGGGTGPGNCIIDSIWNNSNGQFPVGTTIVKWYAKFTDGSIDSCTQKITRLAPVNVNFSWTTQPLKSNDGKIHICKGDPVYFSDSGAVGIVKWDWYFGDGYYSNLTNPVHYYNFPGTFMVFVIGYDVCNNAYLDSVEVVVDPTSGPKIDCPSVVCAGDTGQYHTNDTCATATYLWTVTGGTIIGSATNSTVNVVWGAGPIGVLTLSVSGCPGLCDKPTVALIKIVPTLVNVKGDTIVCQGTPSSEYEVQCFPGSVYSWSISPVAAGTIVQNGMCNVTINWNPLFTGTVTITVNYNNILTGPGCDLPDCGTDPGCGGSGHIIVNVLPVFKITGPNPLCQNVPAASPFISNSVPTTWGVITPGNVYLPALQTGLNFTNYTWNAGPGIYTVVATTTATTFCNDSAYLQVQVLPLLPAPILNGPDTVCANSPITYTVTPNAMGVQYVWTITNGAPGGVTTTNINSLTVSWFPGGGTLSVKQVLINSPFCESPTTTKNISIYPPVILPIISGNNSVCIKSQYPYSFSPSLPANASFSWSIVPSTAGKIVSANGINPVTIEWLTAGPAFIKLKISSCTQDSVMYPVNVHALPTPTVAGLDTTCTGINVVFTGSGNPADNFLWNFGDPSSGVLNTAVTYPTASHTFATSGIYIVTLTETNLFGCSDSSIFTITVEGTPVVPVITGLTPVCVGPNAIYSFNTITYPLYPGALYTWSLSGGALGFIASSGSSFANVTWTGGGSANVILTINSICMNTSISFPVTINPIPVPVISGPFTGCQGSLLTFSNTGTPGTETWDFGAGPTANPSFTYNVPGTYTVQLTANAGGCTATTSATVTINPLPVAAIWTPNNLNSCTFPITITLNAVNFAGYSFAWYENGNPISSNVPSVFGHIVNYPSPKSYTCIVTNSFGCTKLSNTLTFDTANCVPPVIGASCPDTIDFTWSAPVCLDEVFTKIGNPTLTGWDFGDGNTAGATSPVPHTYALPGVYPVTVFGFSTICNDNVSKTRPVTVPVKTNFTVGFHCNGSNVMVTDLYDASFYLNTPASYTYLWSFNNVVNNSFTNQQNISVIIGSGTLISLTIIDPATGDTCTFSQTITVPVPITASFTTTNTCAGVQAVFTNTSSPGPIVSSSWNFGDPGSGINNTSTLKDPKHIFALTGNYLVTLTVTDKYNCTSTVTQNISVNSLPTVSISGNPANFTGCNPVVLTASSNLTYNWTVTTPPQTNQTFNVSQSGYYMVTVSNANGCTASAGPVHVIIKQGPQANVTGTALYCPGENLNLKTVAGTGYSYAWVQTPGGPVGGNTPNLNSVPVPAPGNYTYQVTVTANGCTTTSALFNVTVDAVPASPVIVTLPPLQPLTFCEPDSVNLGTLPTGATYLWTKTPPPPIPSPFNTNPTIYAKTTGTYSVVVQTANNCPFPAIPPVVVTVCPVPDAKISGDTAYCAGETLILQTYPGYTYQWLYNGIAVGIAWPGTVGSNATVTIPSLTPGHIGTYSVIVSNACGCSDTVSVAVIVNPLPAVPVIAAFTGPYPGTIPAGGVLCTGQLFTLRVTFPVSPQTNVIYLWNTGQQGGIIPAAAAQNYYVTAYDTVTGCSSVSNIITINPTPDLSCTPTGCYDFCSDCGSVTIPGPTGISSYQWEKDSAGTFYFYSNTMNLVVFPPGGVFRLIAFNIFGCSDTSGLLYVDFHDCCPAPADTCPPCYVSVPNKVENGDFSLGNALFSSSLTQACSCLVGSYCVTTNAFLKCNAFPNAADHTGNGAPNYLVIDGSTSQNQDVWSQNVTVVNNAIYTFSFWVQPVEPNNSFIKPDLQMMINGIPQGPMVQGASLTNIIWSQHAVTWISNVNGVIPISIRQVNAGGGGNDYGLDDIEFEGCEPVVNINAGNDTTICAGSCIVIAAETNDTGLVYQWFTNGGIIAGANSYEINICPEHDTCFTVIACDAFGCCDTDIVCIYVHHPVPLFWNNLPSQVCMNAAPFSLVGYASPPGGTFSGPGITGNIFNPSLAVLGPNIIVYNYPDSFGCPDSIIAVIHVAHCECDTICETFNDQQLHGWGPDPAAPNVLVVNSNIQSQGGANDYYIRATDLPGPSELKAGTAFTGEWCCGEFCYDFRLFDDGGIIGSPNVNPVFYVWSGTKGFAFQSVIFVNENTGWRRICAPVSNCAMPLPFEGSWDTIPGTGTLPSDWNTVMNNITKVTFKVDFNFPGNEITGFDNVCFVPSPLYLSCGGTNATCQGLSNGTANVVVTGGHAPYSYQWSNGQTTQTATGLSSGIYCVTVTDNYGCCDSCCVIIKAGPVVTDSVSHINCDSIYGHIYLQVTGGLPPYHYDWSNGATTENIAVLIAAPYTVTVIDNNGCTKTHTVTVTVTENCNCNSIPAPPPPTITINSIDGDNCNNTGCIHASYTGCCLRYSYSYFNPCNPLLSYSIAPSTDSTIFCNLKAGSYILYVSDLCGNFVTANVVVPFIGPPLNATVSYGNCASTICVNGTGGCPPYTYLWSNGQTTTCLVNPVLCAGYIVTVTDNRGCTFTRNVVAPAITFDNIVNPTCCNANGSLCVYSCFGPNLTYLWSNGATTECITGLSAGLYCVTLSAPNGQQVTCCYNLVKAPPIPPTVSFHYIQCGSMVTAVIDDHGCPDYTYHWTNGNSTSLTRENLVPCQHDTLTIMDCDSNIYQHPFTVPNITANILPINCLSGIGRICITVECFRCEPYSYSWTPASPCVANGQSCIECTIPGVYTVCITNSCGDVICCSYTLPGSSGPVISTTGSALNCFGMNNGTASVTVTGGTPPYTYSWNTNPVKTTASISGLNAGTYIVTVTDGSGCTKTATAVVTQPPIVNVNGVPFNVTCRGGSDGSISLNPSGGISPYTYLWNNGSTVKNRSGLTTGTYTVTVTDVNGCTRIAVFTITQPPTTLIINTNKVTVRCYGAATGTAGVSPSGGYAPYSYMWNTGETTSSIVNLVAGAYTCTVTDDGGCIKQVIIVITENPQIIIIQSQTNVTFPGGSNGTASATVSGGIQPYSYSWNTVPVMTTSSVIGLHAGVYKLTVTDGKSCVAKATYTITAPVARESENADNDNFVLNIFPNPTSGQITIAFTKKADAFSYEVGIHDLSGRLNYHQKAFKEADSGSGSFNLNDLSKGVYFLKVTSDRGTKTFRIVLQ